MGGTASKSCRLFTDARCHAATSRLCARQAQQRGPHAAYPLKGRVPRRGRNNGSLLRTLSWPPPACRALCDSMWRTLLHFLVDPRRGTHIHTHTHTRTHPYTYAPTPVLSYTRTDTHGHTRLRTHQTRRRNRGSAHCDVPTACGKVADSDACIDFTAAAHNVARCTRCTALPHRDAPRRCPPSP